MRLKGLFVALLPAVALAGTEPPPVPAPMPHQQKPVAVSPALRKQGNVSASARVYAPSQGYASAPTLKILLPPEELRAIRQKLELRRQELEMRLRRLKAQMKVQSAQTKLLLTRAELNLTLAKLYLEKIKELEEMKNVSPLPVKGVVGDLVITDKMVLRAGMKLFGKPLEVKNGIAYLGGKPTNAFAQTLADWINRINALEGQAQTILSQVSTNLSQQPTGYRLSSGETFATPPSGTPQSP